eukprot:TRINITY_DN7617_c0_g2_i3.p1 TRINITY_DN7617_c0_g2~~TRINITY_DN7617_c0_g2_i3.p1  ORF type:complete len:313 (+),score=19.68 TRINITY_DN7617_c0_g2_i3:254-1192(+)
MPLLCLVSWIACQLDMEVWLKEWPIKESLVLTVKGRPSKLFPNAKPFLVINLKLPSRHYLNGLRKPLFCPSRTVQAEVFIRYMTSYSVIDSIQSAKCWFLLIIVLCRFLVLKKDDIKRIMSHPQALAQCDGYLRKMEVVKEAVSDTAGAAKMVSEGQLSGVGAIASRTAAELYGLDILEEGIQDMKDNITRFIVLSRDPMIISTNVEQTKYKTSVVFSLKEGPGQLFKALSVFALRDIDMTKMESRPLRTDPIVSMRDSDNGEVGRKGLNYLFYVDFIGTMGDITCQNALRHLQEISPFLRVLGSYPMDTRL